jgi:hypothetical protein
LAIFKKLQQYCLFLVCFFSTEGASCFDEIWAGATFWAIFFTNSSGHPETVARARANFIEQDVFQMKPVARVT